MSLKNPERAIKFLMGLTEHTDPPFGGMPSDLIIPIMGPTGVGKSTFINSVLLDTDVKVQVGHGLQSCTSHLNPIVIEFGHGEEGSTNPNSDSKTRLVLVDTPGFDDTFVEDSEILRRISVWLGKSYATQMHLAGVIYLHDITQTRMLGTTRRNLKMFQKLVGKDALGCVVLGTTKWGLIEPAVGVQREEQLKSDFWDDMIAAGSQVVSVFDQKTSTESDHEHSTPEQIINGILNGAKIQKSKAKHLHLMIQSELALMRKFVPQTDAGQTLKYTLDELIKLQKRKMENLTKEEREKARQELDRLLKTAKELKVPLGARIRRFFNS